MTSGLCTAAVTFTPEERTFLESLPDVANEVVEADGCIYKAGHSGLHAVLAQTQEDDEFTHWWAVWDGPEQPDSVGYEIVAIAPCREPKPGSIPETNDCQLPTGHAGDHRYWRD
ncbi:hypothetical protein [Streptacidiphilus anmyonensis]|uniref:hypothetical protein n=1 Tax=Streptacidiphilus anmyonensis TaxID=405782 RepID=UPI0005A6BAA6|nr:hypothetical protein [Streptacidiphilus anmyonensis]